MTASAARSILPPLSPEERHHSRSLAGLIRAQLAAAGGWLSFERFMELALYAPGLGYYSAGSVKIGVGGDFVTAPEVSDLFNRCVARQCAEILTTTGGGILELGAGTGRMAATVLTALAAQGVLPERYAILEVSADLAARQRARLAQLPPQLRERVVWLEGLPQSPLRGVMLANEVADALPCRRFTWRDGAVRELGVALDETTACAGGATGGAPEACGEEISFREQSAAAEPALARACEGLLASLDGELPPGYVSELCLRVGPWIASLSECLERGVLLLCDYGLPRRHYYHRERASGTLRCHFKQRAHADPYINVGVQDITACEAVSSVPKSRSRCCFSLAQVCCSVVSNACKTRRSASKPIISSSPIFRSRRRHTRGPSNVTAFTIALSIAHKLCQESARRRCQWPWSSCMTAWPRPRAISHRLTGTVSDLRE